jgi:hypothetical protein
MHNHNEFKIEELRRQVASIFAQSMTETEITDRLNFVSLVLAEMSQKLVFDLAKSDLAYCYKYYINGIEENKKKSTLVRKNFPYCC